jgi:hypothetical protein
MAPEGNVRPECEETKIRAFRLAIRIDDSSWRKTEARKSHVLKREIRPGAIERCVVLVAAAEHLYRRRSRRVLFRKRVVHFHNLNIALTRHQIGCAKGVPHGFCLRYQTETKP